MTSLKDQEAAVAIPVPADTPAATARTETDDVRLLAGAVPTGRWSSGLCDWPSDFLSCLVAIKLPNVLFAMNQRRAFPGSSGCTWLLTYTFIALLVFLGVFLTLVVPFVLSNEGMSKEDLKDDGLVKGAASLSTLAAFAAVVVYVARRRAALRARHGIADEGCGDVVTHFFCHPCALAQEARHVDFEERRALAAAADILRRGGIPPASETAPFVNTLPAYEIHA